MNKQKNTLGSILSLLLSAPAAMVQLIEYNRWIVMLAIAMMVLPIGALAADTGTVIIAFDDGWKDTFNNAYSVLNTNGQKAVVFAIPEAVGWDTYMTVSDLSNLYTAGWDISSHSLTHGSKYPTDSTEQLFYLSRADNLELKTELGDSKDWLDNNGFTRSSMFFAYPYGTYDTVYCMGIYNDVSICGTNDVAAEIKAAGYYIGARSIDAYRYRDNKHPKYKLGDADVLKMATLAVEGTGVNAVYSTPAAIMAEIDKTISENGLLVLTFHHITIGNPTSAEEYSKANLTIISDYLKSKGTAVQVQTFSEYFQVPEPIPTFMPGTPVAGSTILGSSGSAKVQWSDSIGNKTDVFDVRVKKGSDTVGQVTYNVVNRYFNITGISLTNPAFVEVTAINRSWGKTNMNPTPLVITVALPFMPPVPVNTTVAGSNNLAWNAGAGNGTTYFNVNVNGEWYNNSVTKYFNLSGIAPGVYNVTANVYAVNVTYGMVTMNPTPLTIHATIPRPAISVGIPTILLMNDMINAQEVDWKILPGLNTDVLFAGTNKYKGEQFVIPETNKTSLGIGELTYNTVSQPVTYLDGTGQYHTIRFIGQNYVTLNDKINKLSKLVINSGTITTLSAGETWDIGDGWVLTINNIDSSIKQVSITLSKDGIVQEPNKVLGEKTLFTHKNTSIAGETDVPMFRTYISEIRDGAVDLNNTWALSSTITEITPMDIYGVFSGATFTATNITMVNNVPIELIKGLVPLMGESYLIVGDKLEMVNVVYMQEVNKDKLPLAHNVTITNDEMLTLYAIGYNSTSRMYSPIAIDSRTILLPEPVVTTKPSSGGSRSSGSGGGGGASVGSDETFDNIVKFENKDGYIQIGKDTTLSFTTINPGIYQVLLSGQSQDISVRVENLKGHQNITTDVSGHALLYTNVIINSARVSGLSFSFKINKSDITDAGNIKAFVWNNGAWEQLDTKLISTGDNNVYFQVTATPAKLSRFAISEIAGSETVGTKLTMSSPTSSDVEEGKSAIASETSPVTKMPGFEVIGTVFVLSILYLRRRL